MRSVLCLQTGEVTGTVTTTAGTSPTLQHSPTVWVSQSSVMLRLLCFIPFYIREMLFPLWGEEPSGAHLPLRRVESGHGTEQSQTCLQNEVWQKVFLTFFHFLFRVAEDDDTSQESLAVVITVGVVAGLAIITLTIALVTLFRTNRQDSKSISTIISTDNSVL